MLLQPCPMSVVPVLQYGVSPYHNNTDKNWITVKDSTWTDIIQPLAKTLSKDKGTVRNCRPGALTFPSLKLVSSA
jgi:hypothetical protein